MKSAHIKSLLRKIVNEEFNDESWMQTVNVREDGTDPSGISLMKKKLTQSIDEIIHQLLKENPDTVRNQEGECVVRCSEGPAIAFRVMKNSETGRADVIYIDTRGHGRSALHGNIIMNSKVDGWERLRGRVWTDKKIASFYESEDEVKPYSKIVEDFFEERELNIDEFNWEFNNSAQTKGFQKWKSVMGGKSEGVEVPAEIKKKIAELIPKLHLATGDAKRKIEQEIEHLYKRAGVENQKAKNLAAYMAASDVKYAPYRKGGGGFMAGYTGRLPAVAEAKVRIYNKTLCPDLWTDQNKLLPEIRKALLKIAFDFYSDAELSVPIQDVYLLGSAANYNWTPESDMDVHILVDNAGLSMHPENAEKFLRTLTGKWNLEHDIKIKGHRVELYLQDIREKNESTGVYSVVHDEWVKTPSPEKLSIDKPLIQKKYSIWVQKINDAIKREDEKALKNVLEALKDYRKAGLKREGEFSPENLVFKILRHRGFLEKLKDGYNQIYDKKMTVKDGFDPTSVGPNPDAGTGDNSKFYQSHIKRMQQLEEIIYRADLVWLGWVDPINYKVFAGSGEEFAVHDEMYAIDHKYVSELEFENAPKWRFRLDLNTVYWWGTIPNEDIRESLDAWLKKNLKAINPKHIRLTSISKTPADMISVGRSHGTVKEVSWKDLKQHHPFFFDSNPKELKSMTLDNLYALLQKSRRFYDAYKKQQDVEEMKKEAEKVKLYSDEIKRRLKAINAPVMEGSTGKPVKSKYFTLFWGLSHVGKGAGIVMLGDKQPTGIDDPNWFINIIPSWGGSGMWNINRHMGAFRSGLEAVEKSFRSPEEILSYLDDWYEKRNIKEGYGAGIPETDRLHIGGRRWQIRSKDAPKTPKMTEEEVLINEVLDKILPLPLHEGLIMEAPKQERLKKGRRALTDNERSQVMKAGAVWHHGPNGEETPAVWKSVVDGKTWFCCNTHRAIQIKPTLKDAIKAFEFIKTTA